MLYEGKPNHMSQARINLLNEIGFEWSGEKRDKFWHDRYHELLQFHSKNGTTRIPPDHPNSQLHTWVSLQRRQLKMYKEGKPTKLTQERIRMLEAVGVECNIRASTTWMDRFVSRTLLYVSSSFLCLSKYLCISCAPFFLSPIDVHVDGTKTIQG